MPDRSPELENWVAHSVGVDGCPGGWVAVGWDGSELIARVHQCFEELVDQWTARKPGAAGHIYVDIPIGLPWRDCPQRACDVLARRMLQRPRASSVFSPPCREASRAGTLTEARDLNQREIGKSLSAQAWGICAKIAEVDRLLIQRPALRELVREVHPELLFQAYNRGAPMKHSKKTSAGRAARLGLLEGELAKVGLAGHAARLMDRTYSRSKPRPVERDDMLDALAALLLPVASRGFPMPIPLADEGDKCGLPMRMWCVPSGIPT